MLTNTAFVVTSHLLFAKEKVLEAYAYIHVLGSDLQMPWRRAKRASKQQPHTSWIKHLLWEAAEGKIQLSTSEKPDPKPWCLTNHHSSHPPHHPTAGMGAGNLTVSTNISGQETRTITCPAGKVLWSHAVAGKKLRCPQSSGLGNCPGIG